MWTPIPVAQRSKARVCDRQLARISGSNSGRGFGCLSVLSIACVVRQGSLRRGATSSEDSCRMWCVVVCDLTLKIETALVRVGLFHQTEIMMCEPCIWWNWSLSNVFQPRAVFFFSPIILLSYLSSNTPNVETLEATSQWSARTFLSSEM